ncbi:unnamed protein product, partial [Ilex paraguariensis]
MVIWDFINSTVNKYMPNDEARANIALFVIKLGKNAANYAVHEGVKGIPGDISGFLNMLSETQKFYDYTSLFGNQAGDPITHIKYRVEEDLVLRKHKTTIMDEKSIYPFPINNGTVEISRTLREVPPSDYLFQIKLFSLLSKAKEKRFESSDFESGGYKWKLCLYPHGYEKEKGKGHISLYLAISEADPYPLGWEVNVKFELFVYYRIRDKYLTLQSLRHFHEFKREFGFAKLLSLDTFKDASNGYLIDDSCVFGAEVYVIKSTSKGECLSLKEETYDNSYSWEIKKFSEIKEERLFSEPFTIGKHKWKIVVYPKGHGSGKGNSLSVFLWLDNCGSLPTKRLGNWFVTIFLLKLACSRRLEFPRNYSITGDFWFCDLSEGWGLFDLISLHDLHDKPKGFVFLDSLVVEVQIHVMSDVKEFSSKMPALETRDVEEGPISKWHGSLSKLET